MKYVSMIILAVSLFIGSMVFGQGEKLGPALSPGSGFVSKQEVTDIRASVLPTYAGVASKESEKGGYQIGVEDILDINVIKPIPFTGRMIVTSDGTITFPYIGSVQAKGRTLSQVQSEIQNRLYNGGYMDYPVVSVSLWEARSKEFTIYGQVYHPGAYLVGGGMPILRAISLAGGLSVPGSTAMIKVLHPNKDGRGSSEIFESDITALLNGIKKDYVIQAGDTIVVTLDRFFVTGQVNHPGAYTVVENMSLLNAISMAGGLTADSSNGKIKLLRPAMGGRPGQQIETDYISVLNGAVPSVSIHAMDTVVVIANKFYVYGEVNKPGMYPLESKTTALTAISIAGGFTRFGSASRVKVIRMDEKTGKYELIKVNITQAIAGNFKADVLLMPGDVVVVSEGVF